MGSSRRRDFLLRRAGFRCEYCRMPVRMGSLWGAHIEHIKPRQHGGNDDDDNLAVSYAYCNFVKGPNIAAEDPSSLKMVRLYHPRHDVWAAHFQVRGLEIVGLTAVGRATATLLHFNRPSAKQRRRRFVQMGLRFD
jgi:hypothetical protein